MSCAMRKKGSRTVLLPVQTMSYDREASTSFSSGIEVLDMHMEKLMVYFAMLFSVVMECVQITYKNRLAKVSPAPTVSTASVG